MQEKQQQWERGIVRRQNARENAIKNHALEKQKQRNQKIQGFENIIRKAVFGFDRKFVQPAGRSFVSAGNDIFYKKPTRPKRRKEIIIAP